MKKIVFLILLSILSFFSINVFSKGFGVGHNKTGERPNVNDEIITNNNGFAIGPDEKSVYLTFDCGYENGYTEMILDTLKMTDIKATFFITGHYLKTSKDIVQRMINEGHLVANHTYSHKDFTQSTNEEIINDLKKIEDLYFQEFNQELAKIVRPPRGEYSEESQKTLASNGYKSIFWSLAYVDWYKDKYYGNDYSYNKVMSRIHNGAIILMHTVSKDNTYDLEKIVNKIKEEGYEFKLVDTL
ncbi:MAG: polysaccharide deacetylase family protein [Anaeroplasma sp.]